MPSGAKKRKAAKKKKGNQPGNHPNPSSSASTNAHGGDKESDVGEVSSPASQDHHSQHSLLTEGEEEEIEKRGKSVEGTKIEVGDEGSAISVEREFKIEDGTSEKNGKFEHDETSRKSSYDGGSSGSSGSSSSSSSDDESHGIKSSQAAVHITPIADSVKVADTFSGEHVEVIDNTHIGGASSSIIENVTPAVPSTVDYVFNANGGEKESSVEHVGVPEASNDAASQEKEAIIPSVENIAQENNDQLNLSCNVPVADADNGRDAEKDSGVTELLLVPAPHAEQPTSWKSCCGLFELFSGSGR